MNKEKTEKRKAQIIEATIQCIADKGYEFVTMNDISKYSQLSKGAINYYFKTKNEIMIEVLNSLDRRLFSIVDEKVKDTSDAEKHLRYRLSGSFEMMREDPTLIYVLLDFASLGTRHKEFKGIIRKFFSKYRYLSSVGAKPLLENGAPRQITPMDVGAVVTALIMGISFQWILDRDGFDFERVSKAVEDMLIVYLDKNRVTETEN